MRLDSNTSAIVTGGASGLGAATCAELAARGVHVFALDLEQSIKDKSAENITYLPTDVTNEQQVRQAVRQAAEIAPLRLAVTCAGICPSARIVGRKGTHDVGLFAQTLNVNLVGTFSVLAAAADVMSTQEPINEDGARGLIVTTASVAAFEGQVGQAAYAASKGGVHALSITAARDLAGLGIRVNSIAPGIVETPMMAGITEEFREELQAKVVFPKRMARPEEFANLVMALTDNDYLNGETIRLDGALRMPPR